MAFDIVHLPRAQWQDHMLPIGYTTEEYYDVAVQPQASGFTVTLEKARFETPVTHTPEEYDFPDRLYEPHWDKACAWGVLVQGRLIAAIETCPEDWSNRLRVTELWVDPAYQRQGIGHALMAVAREQARLERRRAIILETQSCNVNAIGFYLHEGFTLIGMDTCCYQNHDLARKEVRLELGWLRERLPKLQPEALEIRPETPADFAAAERMVQLAFWNKYRVGCDEHYLVHQLRQADCYLPALSRVACVDGQIVGAIYYFRALVRDGAQEHPVLGFGPLAVHPDWQGRGVGEQLLRQTLALAAAQGWPGVVIFGEPDYYPRHGFRTCDHFGITTAEGGNSDAFLALELQPGAMAPIRGSFFDPPELTEPVPPALLARFHQRFPPLQPQYFPSQWPVEPADDEKIEE